MVSAGALEHHAASCAEAGLGLADSLALAADFFSSSDCRFRFLSGAAALAELGIGRERVAALGTIHGLQSRKESAAMAARRHFCLGNAWSRGRFLRVGMSRYGPMKNDLYLSGAFAAACRIALRECKHVRF